ncbi:hypothetical protein P7K49_032093, partial [Saguinus oedipus]
EVKEIRIQAIIVKARQDKATQCKAIPGKARKGNSRQEKARQCKKIPGKAIR